MVGTVVDQCPGSLNLAGYGNVSLVATQWNMPDFPAGPVQALGGSVLPNMWGRAYFADSCTAGQYDNTQYLALKLLGKKLTYTTELSQGGCGCNAAMYLVSMRQCADVSQCSDHYCDANSVCGVRCAEIDIQEANKFAWHSALHKAWDGNGEAAGFGGWVHNGNRYDFGAKEYGPGARCVDTLRPFQVSAAFPVGSDGRSQGMQLTLSQDGGCELRIDLSSYNADPQFEELTRALAEGMTPVVSYWKSPDMLWLDGPGVGQGPCREDTTQCGTAPQFYNFAVESL